MPKISVGLLFHCGSAVLLNRSYFLTDRSVLSSDTLWTCNVYNTPFIGLKDLLLFYTWLKKEGDIVLMCQCVLTHGPCPCIYCSVFYFTAVDICALRVASVCLCACEMKLVLLASFLSVSSTTLEFALLFAN